MSGPKIVHAVTPERSRPSTSPAILLIDAELTIADSIRESLQREGFRVVVAREGGRGIELFRADPPALILVDLILPGLSGLDVIRIIRA